MTTCSFALSKIVLFANIWSVLVCSLKTGFLVYRLFPTHKIRRVSLILSVVSVVASSVCVFVFEINDTSGTSGLMLFRIFDILAPKKKNEMYFVWIKIRR